MAEALAIQETERFPENLPPGWQEILQNEKDEDYFIKLSQFLNREYRQNKIIFPPQEKILSALQSVDFDEVKVVILGQDPYHGPGQAIGLSFAVPNELLPKPPSLLNIFKEIESDVGAKWDREQSDLSGWADQGVLLLNTVLTVQKNQAFSHRDQGWEIFTDKIISALGKRTKPLVFILWGAAARKKKAMIEKQHRCMESPHPSPLSAHRGFFGSKPFSKTNDALKAYGETPIDWSNICH